MPYTEVTLSHLSSPPHFLQAPRQYDRVVQNVVLVQADLSLIPVLGISPGEENGSSLQYSCLENPMDRGEGWQATDHRVAKRQT